MKYHGWEIKKRVMYDTSDGYDLEEHWSLTAAKDHINSCIREKSKKAVSE
jgi:hypothetical protein